MRNKKVIIKTGMQNNKYANYSKFIMKSMSLKMTSEKEKKA